MLCNNNVAKNLRRISLSKLLILASKSALLITVLLVGGCKQNGIYVKLETNSGTKYTLARNVFCSDSNFEANHINIITASGFGKNDPNFGTLLALSTSITENIAKLYSADIANYMSRTGNLPVGITSKNRATIIDDSEGTCDGKPVKIEGDSSGQEIMKGLIYRKFMKAFSLEDYISIAKENQ